MAGGLSVIVRRTTAADLPGIFAVHRAAFPDEAVAELTAALLADPTAEPVTSLLALQEEEPVGHILFTGIRLEPAIPGQAAILAPLGVLPDWQNKGVGGLLVREGLAAISRSGVGIVFVLGHPDYYPRFGFVPAGERGFAAPYTMPPEHADAWMVLSLSGDLPNAYQGTVRCAHALDRPEYWRE